MGNATWITLWNESAAHWGEAMWRACWQGGLFVLIVWGVCLRWRSMPSTLRCGLWWLVCLKLLVGLCPVFLSLPLLPPAPDTAVVVEGGQIASHRVSASGSPTPVSAPPLPAVVRSEAGRRPSVSGIAWLLGAWLLGTGTLVGITARALWRLRRLARQAELLSESTLLERAQEAATAMGMRALPRLLVTQADVGVLTLGMGRPVVLLSQPTLACCSPSELRLILAHEFAHIRRGDVWLGLLPNLTRILFWFHPLAWLACREFVLAREVACDEQTLCSLPARSDVYGRLLLKLGTRQTSWFTLCTPGVSSHFRILHRRISMLQQITEGASRKRRGHVVLFGCLVGAAIMVPWSIVQAQKPGAKASGDTAQAKAVHVPGRTGAAIPGQPGEVTLPGMTARSGSALSGTKPISPKNVKPLLLAQKPSSLAGNMTKTAALSKAVADKRSSKLVGVGAGIAAPDPDTPSEFRVLRLRHADAAAVEKMLITLFGDRPGKSDKIVADPRTNAIIVQAKRESLREIEEIVHELDREGGEQATEVRTVVVPLKYAKAPELASTLATLFEDKSAKKRVRIAPDARTNTLVIQASEEMLREVMGLLDQLDRQDTRRQ
jgi:beta-lactamase regulating signal transducer with metallopeptidase domain